jgi:putative Holliday junction resolvase
MSRIVAIDFGTKRIGLAVTDPSRIIATALDTVLIHNIFPYLKAYNDKEGIERFVVGEPKNVDNTPSSITPQIEQFIRQLNNTFPAIPVDRIDERYTSKMAARALIDSGLKKKDRQRKELVDQTSAVIILQSWMALQSHSS